MRFERFIKTIVLTCFIFLGFPGLVLASPAPSAIDVSVFQGDQKTFTLPVEKTILKSTDARFSIVHVSFAEDGSPNLGSAADDVSWISFSKSNANIESETFSDLVFIVNPDSSVQSGSYVFAILVTNVIEGAISFAHGTATLVFITVGSPAPLIICKSFSKNQNGSFNITLQNEGQGILYDEGKIVLKGPFDIAFSAIESNPLHRRVLAGQTRSWTSDELSVPWWAFGPMHFSFETDFLSSSCSDVDAGIRWIPLVFFAGTVGGVILVLRRR
ncbi:MAG: hypothetical protein WCT28_00375 [Patescibacteria group bacterium]